MKLKAAFLCAALVTSLEAGAQEQAVGANVGMLGVGIEYTYPLNERFAIRGGLHGSSYGFDASESGIDYEFDLNWDSISVAVDFYPTQGPLRVSAGILKNDNELSARSAISADVNVGGTTYTPADVGTLRGSIAFDGTAPFVGVGWDWSRTKRIGVTLDLGIVSQGSPRVSLSADGGLAADPLFQDDLDAEEIELQKALEDFDLMPYATLGVVFRF